MKDILTCSIIKGGELFSGVKLGDMYTKLVQIEAAIWTICGECTTDRVLSDRLRCVIHSCSAVVHC